MKFFESLSAAPVNAGHSLMMFWAERQRVEVAGAAAHSDTCANVVDMDAGNSAECARHLCDAAHVALAFGAHASPTNDSAISAIWSSVRLGQYRSATVLQIPRAAWQYSPSSIDSNDKLRGINWMTIP